MAYRFDWDPDKADENLRKHGVSFFEASTVFGDPLAIHKRDPAHSRDEVRFILLGLSQRGRVVVVSYVERDDRTGLINARLASRAERRRYEEEST